MNARDVDALRVLDFINYVQNIDEYKKAEQQRREQQEMG